MLCSCYKTRKFCYFKTKLLSSFFLLEYLKLHFCVFKLKKELTDARTELQTLQQQQTNGTLEQNKIHQVERLNLQNEITSLKSQLQQVETQYAQEVQTARTTINNLEANLIEQKNKNDVSVFVCFSGFACRFYFLSFRSCVKRTGK